MFCFIYNGFISLLGLVVIICVAEVFEKSENNNQLNLCSNRCNRLLKRSMNNNKKNPTYFENILKRIIKIERKNHFPQSFKDIYQICWLENINYKNTNAYKLLLKKLQYPSN